MALEYLAGQRLTADALQRAVPDRVLQNNDQNVTSSTVPVSSEIVVTVDGLLRIDLEVRYTSGGGGFRWDWADSGSITLISRGIAAPGATATGSPTDVSTMYWRSWINLTSDASTNHFNTSSTQRVSETLVVDGSGTLTFRFAQDASNVAATTLFADSYAIISRLGS